MRRWPWVIGVIVAGGCGEPERLPFYLVDARVDAPPWIDPPAVCSPLRPVGQQGCPGGQHCTWQPNPAMPTRGILACAPSGAIAVGGACTAATVTTPDGCAAGLICADGVCEDICDFNATTAGGVCAPGFNCTRTSNLFANDGDDPFAGVCDVGCDPLTQLRGDGGTCGPGKGCYVLSGAGETLAVCLAAGTIAPGQDIVGQAVANSCVPGAMPRRKDASGAMECAGLCRPADVTATMNGASEGGVGADSCASRWGAAAPEVPGAGESCRYWHWREPFVGLSTYSNYLGWCYPHARFQYDSDLDGSLDRPVPRCTDLTTGDVEPPVAVPPGNDALAFGCVAAPIAP